MVHEEAAPKRRIFSNLTLSEQRLRIGENTSNPFFITRMQHENEIVFAEQNKHDDYPRLNQIIGNAVNEYFEGMSNEDISHMIGNLHGYLDITILDSTNDAFALSPFLRLPYPDTEKENGRLFPEKCHLNLNDIRAALEMKGTDSNRVYKKLKQMCAYHGATITPLQKESQTEDGDRKLIFTLLITR